MGVDFDPENCSYGGGGLKRAHKEGALQPGDIAQAIMLILTLPRRAKASQILIRPTIDTAAM